MAGIQETHLLTDGKTLYVFLWLDEPRICVSINVITHVMAFIFIKSHQISGCKTTKNIFKFTYSCVQYLLFIDKASIQEGNLQLHFPCYWQVRMQQCLAAWIKLCLDHTLKYMIMNLHIIIYRNFLIENKIIFFVTVS